MASEEEYGDDDDKNLIEILEENVPIDISKYISHVSSPDCGAIATFSGTTRDAFDGRRVVSLRYEAYPSMAVRRIRHVIASARATWRFRSAAVAHRVGLVGVGETSVFVAVAAVHRTDALEACRFVIDEVKASVPVWKKEVYEDGEAWKENPEFFHRKGDLVKKTGCCGSKTEVESDDAPVS